MTYPWSDLQYWKSGEFQVVRERIDDEIKAGVVVNPPKAQLFKALSVVPLREVRVVIVGQDPYPSSEHATGVAFSVPEGVYFPQTLKSIFKEYTADLRYPMPTSGDLSRWTDQGVLLWNAIPSTRAGHSLFHNWDEWKYLTREIVQRCAEKGVVFAFLGATAREFAKDIDERNNRIILTSHPSPRGSLNSRTPFEGSRLFSTINARLNEIGLDPIDWRLDGVARKKDIQKPGVVGGDVLPNITGADLGGHPGKAMPNLYTPETVDVGPSNSETSHGNNLAAETGQGP